MREPWGVLLALSACAEMANGLVLDLNSTDSIKSVASTLAFDMMSYYQGNLSGLAATSIGILPGPPPNPSITNEGYFWWEAGAMWGSLIDYWYYTGDATYNDQVMQGLQAQVGANDDYLPQSQRNGMGNDDQAFWAMSALTAAEYGFPNPPADQPQWLALAQAVYNIQLTKFDDICGGGLHWQAFTNENGYTYKNSIANGGFFNIAARLALYTGNASYAAAAVSTYDWVAAIGLIDDSYNVYDGADSANNKNCSVIVKQQFSYNAGIFLLGAATMYNYTNGDPVWKTRVEGFLKQTINIFFPGGIAYEVACEQQLIHCTIDMLSYKAYLIRWMAASTKLASFIYDDVFAVIQTSAAAAALQCSGSPADHPNGRMCGLSWSKGAAWDGTSGVGQQMAAMEAVTSNLILQSKPPVTSNTGGTSTGDPNAGAGDIGTGQATIVPMIAKTGDKVGAVFLTLAMGGGLLGLLTWLSMPDVNALKTLK